jgi:N-acylneuraminate cytidylyltransferase
MGFWAIVSDRCLAVIPARGGSKGLPGKNIRELLGLPLLVHSLKCAAMVPEITRTVVSTDSEEIAETAARHGGDVPFLRPAALADDTTPMMPVIAHAVAEIERLESLRYDFVLLLDPTSPCRYPEDIQQAIKMLSNDPSADGVVACSRPHFNPFWVGVTLNEDGSIAPAFPAAAATTRRQDAPDFYRINGALYLWRRSFIEGAKSAMSGRQLMCEIDESRAFSVDTAADFTLLEVVLGAGLTTLPWMGTA